jgi:phage tail sheath protein FI
MPVAVSYPGVYVEEVPSGVHTIAGVATSIAAFIGRAVMGPVGQPVAINSFADFERSFGGLDVDCPMSYAVSDFYQNGGSKAVIIRLYKQDGDKTTKATIRIPGKDQTKPLVLEARTEGAWGNMLRARVDYQVSDEVAQKYGLTKDDLFNLTVRNMPNGPQESFLNVTIKESPRRLDSLLATESALVEVPDVANMGFPGAHTDPDPGKSVWDDTADPAKATSTKVVLGGADEAADSVTLTDKADFTGSENGKTGMYALQKVDLFNLLCIPPDTRHGDTPKEVYQEALAFCVKRRAMLIVDAPVGWKDANDITANNNKKLADLGINDENARNAALYFPRVTAADPLRGSQLDTFVSCGMVAGVIARTDARHGVWKAPAGIDAALSGIVGLAASLTDAQNGMLNSLGINCLRSFPQTGPVVWGARTLRGADLLADEYKYIPVRRLALFIEESLYRGTRWVVFEPNDEPLWSQVRLNVGAFMYDLFRQGAFQGQTPDKAYVVKCDKDTTTQNDINLGIVNIVAGFAPLKPAEFVVINIQQSTDDPVP